MPTLYLKSQDIPRMPIHAKECVNEGLWSLYEASSSEYNAAWILQTESHQYFLNRKGDILAKKSMPFNHSVRPKILFSDITTQPIGRHIHTSPLDFIHNMDFAQ